MCPLSPNDLQRIFEKLDANGDGLVSLEELNWLLEKIGCEFSLEELELSVGKKGLDLGEFVLFCGSTWTRSHGEERGTDGEVEEVERDLAEAFKVFDLDGDGFITGPELECVLRRLGLWDGRGGGGKDCGAMIGSYDANSDGKLDFEEFKSMMMLTTRVASGDKRLSMA